MTNPFTGQSSYSPETLEAALEHLQGAVGAQIRLAHDAISADEGRLFPDDFVLLGTIQRSIDLIDAFKVLTERGNSTAAIPLLRIQLDSCMRLFACSLLPDKSELLIKLLEGKSIRKIRTPDGHQLTDAFLHGKLSEVFPWFSHVYEFACQFVHLSAPAMMSGVTSVGTISDRSIEYRVGPGLGKNWPETERKEAADAFIAATEALCSLTGSWILAKRQGASMRTGEDTSGRTDEGEVCGQNDG
jgi:hypothetical protein